MGVYDQLGLEVEDESQNVLDFVLERVQANGGADMSVAPNEARKLLDKFEFPRPRWQTRYARRKVSHGLAFGDFVGRLIILVARHRVSMLSGGEKRRLQLLSVLSKVSR